jgi:hypothetical protein
VAEQLIQPLPNDSASASGTDLSAHLKQICGSKAFESSTTLKNLLIYLFQHRDESVNEYAIAVEVLNRRSDFDPHIDATVRVQIARLRRRLKDFYLAEGSQADVRFTIPLGGHQLVLIAPLEGSDNPDRGLATHHGRADAEVEPQPAKPRILTAFSVIVLLSCMVVALALLSGWLAWQMRFERSAPANAQAVQLLPFWREFDSDRGPIHIVIPNPTFFTWPTPTGSDLLVRDTLVNGFPDLEHSPELAELKKQLGKPQLGQFYVVSSDVAASLKLTDYLNSSNANADVTFSSDASIELLEDRNTVLIGTPGTLASIRQQLGRLYFKFDPQGRVLLNPIPTAHEPQQFTQIDESSSRTIYPGLIAFISGSPKTSHLLILAGQRTKALVSYLTSASGSQQLQEARSRLGKGKFFEAVILSEMDGDTVLNNSLAAIRAYPEKMQN